MPQLEQYGPDNPRPWDPNDVRLKSKYAPHETGGVLRMQRVGFTGSEMTKMFRVSPAKLMSDIRNQLNAEDDASKRNKPIHDGSKSKGIR